MFDQIKRNVSIETAIERYVPDAQLEAAGPDKKKMKCPYHDEQNASFFLFKNTNSFFCFSCGEGGSIIDFAMKHWSCNNVEAAKRISSDFNLNIGDIKPLSKEAVKKKLWFQEFIQSCHNNLSEEHYKHLQSRGFSRKDVNRFQIGYETRQKPTDSAIAQTHGLISDKGYYLPYDRYIIPILRYGEPRSCIFYRPGGNPKYLYPKGKKILWGAEQIRKDQEIFLTEGAFDFLSIQAIGLPAVCSLGVQLKQEWIDSLKRAKRIFLLLDPDQAGEKAADKIARDLFPKCRICSLPEGQDINDLFQSSNIETFKKKIGELRADSIDALQLATDKAEKFSDWERNDFFFAELLPLLAKIDTSRRRTWHKKNKKNF